MNVNGWLRRAGAILVALAVLLILDLTVLDGERAPGQAKGNDWVEWGALLLLLVLTVPWQLRVLRARLERQDGTDQIRPALWFLGVAAVGSLIAFLRADPSSGSVEQSLSMAYGVWLSCVAASTLYAWIVPMSRSRLGLSVLMPVAAIAIAMMAYRVAVESTGMAEDHRMPGLVIFLIPIGVAALRLTALLLVSRAQGPD